ncbi:hypothetical protein [Thioclava pacifica]|uniref:Uncharacterized protein n=1 Tax=Thioclava pacifica DSM 10166 TaxID=1353537 RepID=A0A074K321_9RHOB|nr:hypothetical protein [Thioclava pacifica]KEO55977.1 hypothetical protein TP2_00225 [Thioclava pacifica DSM 10166]
MKKLAVAFSVIAAPALAHPGHAVAPGPEGHAIAHVAMAAIAIAAVYVALELGRTLKRIRKG